MRERERERAKKEDVSPIMIRISCVLVCIALVFDELFVPRTFLLLLYPFTFQAFYVNMFALYIWVRDKTDMVG